MSAHAPTAEEKKLGMLCHLLSAIGFVPPLIIWLVKKRESSFVCAQAREVLNLQIHLFLGMVLIALLTPTPTMMPGFVLAAIYVALLVIAARRAWQGSQFRYPLIFRPIR